MKKAIAIILIIMGSLNIVACIAGFMRGNVPERYKAGKNRQFIMAIGLTGLGIYLLQSAKPKKADDPDQQEEKKES